MQRPRLGEVHDPVVDQVTQPLLDHPLRSDAVEVSVQERGGQASLDLVLPVGAGTSPVEHGVVDVGRDELDVPL